MADGLLSEAEEQSVTTYGGIKAPERVLKDPLSACDFDACQIEAESVPHKQHKAASMAARLLCRRAAGVHNEAVPAKNPRSFDGSDAFDCTV